MQKYFKPRLLAGSVLVLAASLSQAAVTPVTEGATSIKLTSIGVLTNDLGLSIGFEGDTSITGFEDGFPIISFAVTGGSYDDVAGTGIWEHAGSGLSLMGNGTSVSISGFVVDTAAGTVSLGNQGVPPLPLFTIDDSRDLLISTELSSAMTLLYGTPDLTNAIFGELILADAPPTTEVPVPAAAWLFGSALTGLMATRRKRARLNSETENAA